MESNLVFHLPRNREERKHAIDHISNFMFTRYKAYPDPTSTPEHLFLITQDDKILATLGIDFGSESKKLVFEKSFSFCKENLPFSYERSKMIFYSRWTSVVRKLGPVVWALASKYALDQGYVFSSSLGKPSIYNLFDAYGCPWKKIEGAEVVVENISIYDHSYFFQAPHPSPYIGKITEQIQMMNKFADKFIKEGRLIVNI